MATLSMNKVSLNNWRKHPYNRYAFSHVNDLIPSSIIEKGKKTTSFQIDLEDLSTLSFIDRYNEKLSLAEFLNKNLTDSFVVIKRGKKIFEWFDNHKFKNKQHILFSVSKSLTGLLTGLLIRDGIIEKDKEVSFYIPEVNKSAYKNATIRNLLDMTVSTDFKEDYLDETGLFSLYRQATGFNRNTSGTKLGLNDFLKKMPSSKKDHGLKYQYCSPNSDLIGWIIERTTQEQFSKVFSKRIFQKCEPYNNAYITLDSEGSPRTAGGICMTIDDLSKIAEMVRCKGSLENKSIISEDLMVDIIDYENKHKWPNQERGRLFPEGGYQSMWYQTGLTDKEICAIGIHGQWVWINPVKEVSILMLSSRKQPLSITSEQNFSILCSEICNKMVD